MKTRAKYVLTQVDIALILSASNQSTHKEFSVPLEFFQHRQRKKELWEKNMGNMGKIGYWWEKDMGKIGKIG